MHTGGHILQSARIVRAALLVSLLALATGCTSTPQASADRDAAAKAFVTHPATAAIYIYRIPGSGVKGDSVLYVNGRLIGSTLPGGFFRVDARPGMQVLNGVAHDSGRIEFEARAGEIRFVALEVVAGISHFSPRDAQSGRRELLDCCVLLENWAPGQRPLLR